MKLCLVGHGKSLEGAGRGLDIDACDGVVRFKKGWQLCTSAPDDYGKRVEFLIASTEVPGVFIGAPNTAHFIAYPKYGFYDEKQIEGAEQRSDNTIYTPLNLFNFWNFQFRQMGARHPNVSVGLAGVIVLAHEVRPKEMVLAGFDSLLDPYKPFERIEAVPRTGTGPFPDHDWHAEHKLLERLSTEYKFKITPL